MVKIERRYIDNGDPQTPHESSSGNHDVVPSEMSHEEIERKIQEAISQRIQPDRYEKEMRDALISQDGEKIELIDSIQNLRQQSEEATRQEVLSESDRLSQDPLFVEYISRDLIVEDPTLFRQIRNLFTTQRIEASFDEILHHEAFITFLRNGGSAVDYMDLIEEMGRGDELFEGGRDEVGTVNFNRALVLKNFGPPRA